MSDNRRVVLTIQQIGALIEFIDGEFNIRGSSGVETDPNSMLVDEARTVFQRVYSVHREKIKQKHDADKVRYRALLNSGCHGMNDGDCSWEKCPQLADNEPQTSHRHCPLDRTADPDYEED